MKITLYPSDLKPQYQKATPTGGVDQNILTNEITFDHFHEDVQDIVRVVGRAEFQTWNGNNAKVIEAPKRGSKVAPEPHYNGGVLCDSWPDGHCACGAFHDSSKGV